MRLRYVVQGRDLESYKDIHDFWNAKNALKGSRFEERIVRFDGELCSNMVK